MSSTIEGDINDILEKVGGISKYQLYMLFWSSLCNAVTAMQTLVIVFTQAEMDFKCADSTEEGITPVMYTGSEYNTTMSNQSVYGACEYPNTTIECSSFVYSSSVYKSSIISEFGLVCTRRSWPMFTNMFFMFSRIPGGLLAGQLVDKIGRKKTLVIGLFLLGAFGLGTAYSVNIAMHIVFRALSALPIMIVYDGCATFLTEVVAPRHRAHIVIGLVFSWGSGITLLSAFGYFLRDWRTLQMAITVPSFLLCLVMLWVFDESPHWLYSQNRLEEAQKVLEKMADWNGYSNEVVIILREENKKVLSTSTEDNKLGTPSGDKSGAPGGDKSGTQGGDKSGTQGGDKSGTQGGDKSGTQSGDKSDSDLPALEAEPQKEKILKIIRNKKFMIILTICVVNWFACDMGYAGLAFGLSLLPGDAYVVNAIGGGVELVSYCIAFLVIPGGRKRIYMLLMAVGGIGLMASAVVQQFLPDITWLTIATTMVGRLSVSACWQILFLWCMELFPTTIRVTMLEISMFAGHIGSAIAPIINDTAKEIKNPNIKGGIIPPLVYGTVLIISSVLSIYLPETRNKSLPVNLEEATSNIAAPREKRVTTTKL